MTIIWLDDRPKTVDYEQELIEEENSNVHIESFQLIGKLMEYLEYGERKLDAKDTIFIIDVMLIGETRIEFGGKTVSIPEELMAGIVLIDIFLSEKYPEVPIIIYTSRGGQDADIFKDIIKKYEMRGTLYVAGKEEFETNFKQSLKSLNIEAWQ